jgi:hypothetical protein
MFGSGFVRVRSIVAMLVVILFSQALVSGLIDGTIEEMGDLSPTREGLAGGLPRTSTLLKAGEGDWIDKMEGIRLGEDSYLELDPFDFSEISSFEASSLSTRNLLSASSCAVEGDIVFIGYVKEFTSPQQKIEYKLAISEDRGRTFVHVDVESLSGVTTGHVELLIHEEKLFYASIQQSLPSLADIKVRVTPLLNCRNLTSVEPEIIDIVGNVNRTKMVGVKDRMILFAKR